MSRANLVRDKRSEYLVHWTGKDIERQHRLNPDERRRAYIERLHQTLLGDPRHYANSQENIDPDKRQSMPGLWMTWSAESLLGDMGRRIEHIPMPVTCFTELPLTSARGHATRYGSMGFGFTRQFILKRRGNPVLYVAGRPEYDVIISNIFGAMNVFGQFESEASEAAKRIAPRTGFDVDMAISTLKQGITDSQLRETLEDILRWLDRHPPLELNIAADPQVTTAKALENKKKALWLVAAYLKNMSECPADEDMTYLNEMEWRIVHSYPVEDSGLICETQPALSDPRLLKNPPYKIPFDECDLKVLVLPDADTKNQVLNDDTIRSWFGSRNGTFRYPIILTIDDLIAI